MRLLAIDPGYEESALLLYDTDTRKPVHWVKTANQEALDIILASPVQVIDRLAVEMIASYGMAVGKEVFDTCVWIGRFIECWEHACGGGWQQVFRREVKTHLCADSRAKDANIRQALIDRYGGKEQAIGEKASPGPLYGLTGDCWAALGVAVTCAETRLTEAAA